MLEAPKCNLSNTDAYIRLVLSFFLMVWAVYSQSYYAMFGSMALALNGIQKHCYLYGLFNFSTKSEDKNKEE